MTVDNTITKTDLKNILGQILPPVSIFYPVGSYYETSDTSFNPNTAWGGTWILEASNKDVLMSSNSITVAAAQDYNITTLTLLPNTEYIVLGRVGSNQGGTLTIGCFMTVTGATTAFGGDARTTTSSGQGVVNYRYVKTGNDNATVTLSCYGYYTTSHTESGHLVAFPIYNTHNNRWHRTA